MEYFQALWEFLWENQIWVAMFLALVIFIGFRIRTIIRWFKRREKEKKEGRSS